MSKLRSAAGTPKTKHNLKPLVAALICAGYGVCAQAQSDTSEKAKTTRNTPALETVEVRGEFVNREASSSKFTAPLLDTPQTLQIIPSEVFAQQGAQNLTDVLGNTPGISFNAGENGFSTGNSNFSLRGFDTSGSIFIDGARDSGSYNRDVFNVEQVEVAKGPAADNGRGSAGGYVNVSTKTPKLSNFRAASVTYGTDEYDSDARQRATLDVNQQLSSGTAVRLNVLVEDSGVAGRELANKSSVGVAPSLALGLDSSTRLIFAYQHLEQEERPDWGVPAAMIKGTFRYDATAARADRDNYYGLASDYDDVTSDSLLVRFEHDFSSGVKLSNQTRWGKTDRESRFSSVMGYVPESQEVSTQVQIYDREATSITNLTNLSAEFATGSVRHNLAAGVELSREESEAGRYGTTNLPGTDVFNPDPNRAPAAPLNPTQVNKVKVDTQAVYVHDTLTFNDYWQLTGGLRAESYEVEINSLTAAGAPSGALNGYDKSETTVGGKLGLVYKPSQNGSIYAAVGRATLPAGSFLSNPDISRTGGNAFPGFVAGAKVQESTNYELGTKWNFYDDRLIASVAYFHTEKSKVAITGRDEGETSDSLKGYGKQIVEGFEVGISGQITENWNIFGGFVLMDSEREHSEYLDEVRRRANPGDYGSVLRTSGDELAFTPKESASLWTTYEFAFGLTLGGGIRHVGDSWAGRPDDASRIIPNGTFGKLPGYTVANLMASYRFNDHIALRLNVDNVTDETYATSLNWPAQRALLGSPRAYLLSADIQF